MRDHFTRDQVEELRVLLAGNAAKDTDFPEAKTITDSDAVAIVQDGKNKKISAVKLIDEISKIVPIKVGNGLQKSLDNVISVKSASLSTDAVKVVIGDSGVKAIAQTASSTQAGVVKIGKRLSIDSDGVLSADEQITEEEKKKLSAVKVIEPDEQTIKSEVQTSGAIKIYVDTIKQSQVEGLEEALAKKGGKLKISDIEVPHDDDGTMHFDLGRSLMYDKDSNRLDIIWN